MTSAAPPPNGYMTRITPDQVLCSIGDCESAASFLLHKFSGERKSAVDAYCEGHVIPIAEDLGIRIPD